VSDPRRPGCSLRQVQIPARISLKAASRRATRRLAIPHSTTYSEAMRPPLTVQAVSGGRSVLLPCAYYAAFASRAPLADLVREGPAVIRIGVLLAPSISKTRGYPGERLEGPAVDIGVNPW
jgi:hypothetical protein